jgi:hypothetical protein
MTRMAKAGGARRRVLGLSGAVALVLVLAACNPLSVKATPSGLGFSYAEFTYTGPSEVWFEAAISGTDGYQVDTEVAVHVPVTDPNAPPVENRYCGSAVVKRQRVVCEMGYPEFPHNAQRHRTDLDAAGAYWPYIVIRNGEWVQVHVYCSQGGVRKTCPADTKVSGRTTDTSEKLVGDLKEGPG